MVNSFDVKVMRLDDGYRYLVANEGIAKGRVLGTLTGSVAPSITKYTIAIGEDEHLMNDNHFIYMDHSCDPNVCFRWNDECHENSSSALELHQKLPEIVTLRDISVGEKMAFNYLTTEWTMVEPFECYCGFEHCFKYINGFKNLRPEQYHHMEGIVSPHVQRLFKASLSAVQVSSKKVCVLVSSYEGTNDRLKDYDSFACNPSYKNKSHQFDVVPLKKIDCFSKTRQLIKSAVYDSFFNLCDGAMDMESAGIDVIRSLEAYGAAFTGAPSKVYEPSKIDMKILVRYEGINVPPYFMLSSVHQLMHLESMVLENELSFPVIVKHPSGYSSVGMTKDSKCLNLEQLKVQATSFLKEFGEALVENFIEGREVTVFSFEGPPVYGYLQTDRELVDLANRSKALGSGVSNDEICSSLLTVEAVFKGEECFKHFNMKWVDYDDITWKPVRDPVLDRECREIGRKALKSILGGIGYGRSDLRIDKNGKVWFLEINPNCGLFYPKGFFGSADYILEFDGMVDSKIFSNLMVEASIRRKNLNEFLRPPYEMAYRGKSFDHFMRASRNISEGELIFSNEGKPVNLVSLDHVQRLWGNYDKKVFARFAWPISKGLYAIWSEDFHEWKPINHNCDPSCWFGENNSLNVYARRSIKKGETLTMDYATFCVGETVEEFTCQCNSSLCRKKINGKRDAICEVADIYGSRVSSFVSQISSFDSN